MKYRNYVTSLLQGSRAQLGQRPASQLCKKTSCRISSYRHPTVRGCFGMRIMIVTDAWFPQTNGVVSTLAQTAAWLGRFGHEVRIINPGDFHSVACPTYPEIRLSILPYKNVERSILMFSPEALHIATEGPLGMSARRFCVRHGVPFTTSYHT